MIKLQQDLSGKTLNLTRIFHNYLQKFLKKHTNEEIILEFNCLFVEGISQDVLIRETISEIVNSKIEKEDFIYILKSCIYLTIDFWLEQGYEANQESILQLIQLFDDLKNYTKSYSRRKLKILALTQKFIDSEDYAKLKRIGIVLAPQSSTQINYQLPIQDLLFRYTYLYQSPILETKNIESVERLIKTHQINYIKAFELKLSQHIIYRSRLVEIARARQFSSGAGKIIRRIANPTLLSDRDLKVVLKQYIKKLDGKITLYQLSRNCKIKISQKISYRQFKQALYDYLIYQIEPRNLQFDFSAKLWKVIDRAYYQSDNLPLNESLIFRTCRKLYQALIINNYEKENHQLLLSLISNLGTAQTVMLLIKIVLICPQAKPDLEQRLANLFMHYELKKIEDVPWIVKFLEQFLIAFSIYFGQIDLSLAKVI